MPPPVPAPSLEARVDAIADAVELLREAIVLIANAISTHANELARPPAKTPPSEPPVMH